MEEEPPTEEVPAEVVGQAKQDLGETTEETDEMERNVGFAKPQVSPQECSQVITTQSAKNGQE